MFKKGDSSNEQKMDGSYTSFDKIYGKMSFGFCLNTGKHSYLEVLF